MPLDAAINQPPTTFVQEIILAHPRARVWEI